MQGVDPLLRAFADLTIHLWGRVGNKGKRPLLAKGRVGDY